jgi:hypothetical protein
MLVHASTTIVCLFHCAFITRSHAALLSIMTVIWCLFFSVVFGKSSIVFQRGMSRAVFAIAPYSVAYALLPPTTLF